MQRGIFLFCFVSFTILFSSCSESTGPSEPALTLKTLLSTSTVRQIAPKEEPSVTFQNSSIDSIHVNRARFLIRRLKLHSAEDDSSGRDIKTDAFILLFTPQERQLLNVSIPEGLYRWIKFEFHRLSGGEVDQYKDDSTFADFVTPERYSAIIEGQVYRNGDTLPETFTYQSQMMANVALHIDPPAEVTEASLLNIVVELDPALVFVNNGTLLDPLDPDNRSEIEGNIRKALKALRR